MIIVKLMGGLGNQMFQYAAGRSLACRLGVDLKLDLSCLGAHHEGDTPRPYELGCFKIAADKASEDDVAALLGRKTVYATLRAKLCGRLGLQWELSRLYREPHYHYDQNFECLSDNVYLAGYWHSERYFAPIADRIAQEFTCRHPLLGRNLEIASDIDNTESVTIHVRRGDYVADRRTGDYHGVCSLEYYRAAIAELAKHTERPHFFIFTDDHSWVKAHLLLDFPATYVDCNGQDKGYEDLRLMSHCKHHIIANSSFSWWGAWLNRNPAKIVVAPRKWFNGPNPDTKDLIPAGWIRL